MLDGLWPADTLVNFQGHWYFLITHLCYDTNIRTDEQSATDFILREFADRELIQLS